MVYYGEDGVGVERRLEFNQSIIWLIGQIDAGIINFVIICFKKMHLDRCDKDQYQTTHGWVGVVG